MGERTPRERLYWLISLFVANQIETDKFCNEFHITFDHDADHNEFSSLENKEFGELAEIAARFSPFEEDLKLYPNVYCDEKDIVDKINQIVQALKILE
ncbi:magnesium and cobalt transport protein CorA [Brevibacillus invocatus]|uniref:Magnesium and cobalt transport protein CorA n=1 Tax=Brevibacillus invocatus TaxID=173959 RepID=A0A3M8CI17_9BACL|nr:magnesium and cobalt transport protein CorA [Brevibacillus invocatus]MCM3082129.1 magnesium and cobalt transport protein CorA [Brevibacillus invocatus]MCM3432607.1 magnesium and cobalt transport protein CorA [Brevibacillus invocatus]RNB74987.1 magnesium and cobalt transport protein CorA [Brevibacillus invocatus]